MVRDKRILRRLWILFSLSVFLFDSLCAQAGKAEKSIAPTTSNIDNLNIMLIVCVCIGFVATIAVLIYFEFDTRKQLEKKFRADLEAANRNFDEKLEELKKSDSARLLSESIRTEMKELVQQKLDEKANLLLANINAVDHTLSQQVQEITGSFTKQVKQISENVAKKAQDTNETMSKEALESNEVKFQNLRAEYKTALKAMAKVVDQQMTAVQHTISESRNEIIDLFCASQFAELLDDRGFRVDAIIEQIRKNAKEEKIIELAERFPSTNVVHILRLLSDKKPAPEVAGRLITSAVGVVDDLMQNNRLDEAARMALQIIDAGEQLNAPVSKLLPIVKKVATICGTTKNVADAQKLHDLFVKLSVAETGAVTQTDVDEMLAMYKVVYPADKAEEMHRLIQQCLEAFGRTLDSGSLSNSAELANVLTAQSKFEEAQVVLLNIASDLAKTHDALDDKLPETLKAAVSKLVLHGRLREAEVIDWQIFEAFKTREANIQAKAVLTQLRAIAQEYGATNKLKESAALYVRRLRSLNEINAGQDEEIEALNDVTDSLKKADNYNELAKLMPEVIAKYASVFGEQNEKTIERIVFASDVYSQVHDFDHATELMQNALTAASSLWGEYGDKTVELLNSLADLWNKQARYAEAEQIYRKILAFQGSNSDVGVAKTYTKLGDILSLQKRYEEAEGFLKKALEIAETSSSSGEGQEVLPALMVLASLYMTTGKYKDAEPCYKRILEVKYKVYGENSQEIISSLCHLGELYNLQNNFAESEVFLETALETAQHIYTHDDIRLANVMFQYARVLTQVGRDDEGERLHARAEKIRLAGAEIAETSQQEAMSEL